MDRSSRPRVVLVAGVACHAEQVQAMVQISEVIRYSTSRLIRGQLIGTGIGASIGFGLSIFFRRPVSTAGGVHPATPPRRTTAA